MRGKYTNYSLEFSDVSVTNTNITTGSKWLYATIAFEDCMEHHEEVNVLFLNRANRVLSISNVAKGGVSGTFVDVKIILQTALKVSALFLALSHNHPSGSLRPSSDDLVMTKIIQKGCEAVGIKLLDHVIMSEENYCSFAEEGLLCAFFLLENSIVKIICITFVLTNIEENETNNHNSFHNSWV